MPVEAYGATFQDGTSEAVIELAFAFDAEDGSGQRLSTASGFLGFYEHLHKAIDQIWNQKFLVTGEWQDQFFIWNEWSELMIRALIDPKSILPSVETHEVIFTGSSSCWKTTCVGCFGTCFWLHDPLNSKVIPSSTSLGGLRERIWKDHLKFYRSSGASFGNIINHPHPKIQTQRGDDNSGIHGIAVEQGDIDAAIDKIKGRHAPNVLMEIDEGTGAQPAIVEAAVNLRTGCNKFIFVMLANAGSYFDEHGKLSEPENGWNSISVDSTYWKTKRGGLAIHLDGHKAPNVLAGYRKYPGMIAQEDLDVAARQYGENSPRYWQERRGFWAPEGITKTILSESTIIKFKAKEKPIWVSTPIKIAACDLAFEGGDKKPLGFGAVGQIDDEGTIRTALAVTEVLYLKVDITTGEPIHFQLTRQIREECKARQIEPYYFGMDTSGEGGGTSDILKREWSSDFLEVEFGGRASDRAISDINPRKGFEEYFNKVSQLWYQVRMIVERGQMRGLPIQAAREFCQRLYEMRGALIMAETKTKMKARIGHSPDEGDTVAIMTEVALVRGLLPSDSLIIPTGRTPNENWREFAKKMIPLSRYAKAS